MTHVDRDAELDVLATWGKPRAKASLETVSRSEVLAARDCVREEVFVAQGVNECLVDIARALRADSRCAQGVSTRSLVQAIPALQPRAMLKGRDFVSTEDIEALAIPLFQHRLVVVPGVDAAEVVKSCLNQPLETLSRGTLR